MTTRANLYVDQGTEFQSIIELDENPNESHLFFCQVSKIYSSVIQFSPSLSLTPPATEESPTILSMLITTEQTAHIIPGKYQYDIVMRNTETGSTTKIQAGLMFILPTITRTHLDSEP